VTTDLLVPVPPLQTVTPGQQQPAIGSGAVASLRCLLVTSRLDDSGMDEVVFFSHAGFPARPYIPRALHASAEGTRDGVPTGRLGRLLLEHGSRWSSWAVTPVPVGWKPGDPM